MATARNYSNTASQAATSAAIASTDTTIALSSFTGYPAAPFTAALARGTANEEIVLVTAVSGTTVTVTRGYDGTTAKAQGAGTTFQEVAIALDFRDANTHVVATSGVHGVTGSVVGTTDTQTLTNKTLTSPSISGPTITGTASVATATVTTLTVTGVTSLASLSTSGGATVGGTLGVAGLTTLTGGATVPTGKVVTLTDAPVNPTDAANKGYVDALGVSAPTVSTVARRDSAGRLQVVDPAVAADVCTKNYVDSNLGISAWTNLPLTGTVANTFGHTPSYRTRDGGHTVELRGVVQFSATPGAWPVTFVAVGGLPTALRPKAVHYFVAKSNGAVIANGQINMDGSITLNDSTTRANTTYFSLDNISWDALS